jgi:uncharacterized protein (TIGR00290 family)
VRVLLSWSGGKDGAMALARLRRDPSVRVEGLLTFFSRDFGRVSMHGVRREILLDQAEAAGMPVIPVELDSPAGPGGDGIGAFPSNAAYEKAFGAALRRAREEGIDAIAFGDIYLADLRRYREALLARAGLGGLFPLWGEETSRLLAEFLESGNRATIVCVDEDRLGPEWAGRELDREAAAALPPAVDPCGENGEYHTFVHDAPVFSRPVRIAVGERVHRPPFWFADILPAAANAAATSPH